MAEALSFEKVWAMFMEDREQARLDREQSQKKWEQSWEQSQKEWEQSREQSQKKWEQSWEQSQKEWEILKVQFKETDRQISKLGNRFGELAEHLVAPNITEKFNKLNFHFENISQNHVIKDSQGRCLAEIDILLENGDIVIAVEVKAKPIQQDVNEHIKRMAVLRRKADARGDTRKFQGAIAGAIMSESIRNFTHKKGFYVIEQTGDTVKITIPEGFTPREW